MKNVEVLLDNTLEKEIFYSKDLELAVNDFVVVNLDGILLSGRVVKNNVDVRSKNYVVRLLTEKDKNSIRNNIKDSTNALEYAKKLKEKLKLEMNFVDSYYTLDRKQLYFLFVSDNRIDFRELAKKLADKYRTRIELRQIGVRDKAKKIGGIGPCGLFLCCNTFLTDFNSVSINMAKNQFLALNPTKINGVCGRLLCCLNYENDTYSDLRSKAPKVGDFYDTPKGKGKIISIDLLKGTCIVELKNHNNIVVSYKETYEKVK